MSMKRKVAILTNIPSPYRVDFFEYLQKNFADYEFHIIFQAGNGASFREWENDTDKLSNVHFLDGKAVADRNTKSDKKEFFLTRGVSDVLKEIAPDVCVISEYNQTALQIRRFCTKSCIPYVSWTDGTIHSERNLHFYHRLARKYLISRAAAFIASSQDSADNQISMGADPKKISISELAVDIHQFDGRGTNYNPNGYLLVVGGLFERKGIDLLLRTLEKCRDLDWNLHLAGTGDAKEDIIKLSEELGINDRIVYRGYLKGEELIKEYEGSSLCVFPTREDCFGLVTLEAMCCAIPVLGSKYAASSRDLIEDGKTGYVIDPFDADSFASVIRKCLSDKDKMREMSKKSKEASFKYDFKYTSKGFVEAIEKAISNTK